MPQLFSRSPAQKHSNSGNFRALWNMKNDWKISYWYTNSIKDSLCVPTAPPPQNALPELCPSALNAWKVSNSSKIYPKFNSAATWTAQHEICALIGYYATYNGNSLRTFRDRLSRNVHKELPLMLRNIPERHISQPLRGGSLKSRTNQPTNGPSVFRATCLLDRSKIIR